MNRFKKTITAGREAEHFTTAFYRVIGTWAESTADISVASLSELIGAEGRKVVTLWGEATVTDFERFWNSFQLDRTAGAFLRETQKKGRHPSPVETLTASFAAGF